MTSHPEPRRLTLAIPNKGRLVEPTLALLHDAGLVFEERDRSLISRVENVALDILFVRTNDVVEFVRDAVADLGITGGDLLAETGVDLPVLRLGYGRCRLAAAVPRSAPYQRIEDLAGLRVATSHPNATRRWFDRHEIAVEVISLSGAVEVAPRLGLAEASSTSSRPGPRWPATASARSASCSRARPSSSATPTPWRPAARRSIPSQR